MRPVEKLEVGESLSNGSPVKAKYSPYGDAYPDLEENLGSYCSYCEIFSSNLDIEHIIPKSQNPAKEEDWTNFLLACRRCNGKDNKGAKVVHLKDFYFPHLNNSFLAFKYREGGLIVPNSELSKTQIEKATDTLDLLGLDKYPGNDKYKSLNPRDKRWQERKMAWDLAERYFTRYKNNDVSAEDVVELALQRGSFSIWFTVFEEEVEFLRLLLRNFRGTAVPCFQEPNYKPIPRNQNEL